MVAGDQVPVIPLGEVVAKTGATEPEHIGPIGAKFGTTLGTTLTLITTGVAETHWPGLGTNVALLGPTVAVFIVAGFQTPVIPLVDAGKAGAVAFWQSVAG